MNEDVATVSESMPKQLTVTEQLHNKKKRLEDELKTINEAIDMFEKNPKISEAYDMMSKIRGLNY